MKEKALRGGRVGPTEYDHLAPLFDEMNGLDEADPRRGEVRERLVTGYLPLSEHIAWRFSGKGVSQDDLMQVAAVGLIHAVDRFDPARGSDFLSFAVPTVVGEVRRHFRDTSWPLRVPRRLQELRLSINQAGGELTQQLGRAPTVAELSEHLGLEEHEVEEGCVARRAYRAVSLDEAVFVSGGHVPLVETVGADDPSMSLVENYQSLAPLLDELPARERRILALRFVGDLTQSQIADRVGISQMHVSRLLSRTLSELREGLLLGARP